MAPARLAILPLLSMLLLLAAPAVDSQQDTEDLVWVIDGETHCVNETWVESRPIVILPTAKLILEGCTLRIDSPAYEDRWVGATNEGRTIRVLIGGLLELRHSGENPAVLEGLDSRYGYYVDVEGTFVSDGLPDEHNVIRGLEGYMAESFLGGGLRVFNTGRAYVNHTAYGPIFGPAVYVHDGGEAHVRDVRVREASGAFAAVNATLSVDGADVNVGFEGIRVSKSTLTLSNYTSSSDKPGLFATMSDVTVRDSSLNANDVAVLLDGSDADFSDCSIRYGTFGITQQLGTDRGATTVGVERCEFSVIPSNRQSLAVYLQDTALTFTDSTVADHTKAGIAVNRGSLEASGNKFQGLGDTDVFIRNTDQFTLDNNTFSNTATRPVRVYYEVDVTVKGTGGNSADVTLGNKTVQTEGGSASVIWEPPLGPDLRPAEGSALVQAAWKGETQEKPVTPTERALVFDFGGDQGSPMPAWVLVVALALAAAAVRRVR